MSVIRAGTREELQDAHSKEWLFVDIGFSSKSRSCGYLHLRAGNDRKQLSATASTFADLVARLLSILQEGTSPLNLVIEAPLSVAFGENGNPCGRTCEKREHETRYWYVGLGCTVLVAAQFLLSELNKAQRTREIRLFEGFVSFKTGQGPSDHKADVRSLANVVLSGGTQGGRFVESQALDGKGHVRSLGKLLGMNFVPPLIVEVTQ